jgi:signal transduction histidine kinase/tetratricopeptide (TPR) repeat protein
MLENLKLAVKRQKKLIVIFLLTIFLPSIALSIFGIRAIRNERFRLARQIENEHRGAAEFLKSQVSAQFKELGSILQNLAQSTALLQRDDADIQNLLHAQLAENPLVDQVFVAFEKEEAWFPLFQPTPSDISSSSGSPPEGNLQAGLERAEAHEFKERNYKSAVSLYRGLFDQSPDTNFKAQMMANISRCLVKAGDNEGAIQNYLRICEDYPQSLSSTGLPLALISQLQMASCYRNLGEHQSSLQTSLDLYKDILHMRWRLREAQFKTYAALVEDVISDILSENQLNLSLKDYREEFKQFKNLHQERLEQWMVIKDIRQNIIPELRGRQALSTYRSIPHQYHKTINERTFLLSAVQIPDSSKTRPVGLLGAKVREQYLIEHVIPDAIENTQFRNASNVVISHLSGKILLGQRNASEDPTTATEFFEDNFPPWRIEVFRSGAEALGAMDIKRSFYFWTILTLVIVLISGAVLISRTIAHEMAVLKLKSDFVSSVSHEFKSPLTSIKALAERLRDGKVKDSDRMKQYFSVITQDVDRLTQLVRNILDFSKIEEGKKEYEFMETDMAQLVTQQIESLKRSEYAKGLEIKTRISEDIPHLDVDKEAFSQALNNLLDNAVKFSSDRKEIEVSLKKDDTNVFIEVRDWGIGIPPHELGRIFDKFYQGRNTNRQSVKGTGLGLTLVKHTVEAHGGRIAVESRVGEGSTFSIRLPTQRKGK